MRATAGKCSFSLPQASAAAPVSPLGLAALFLPGLLPDPACLLLLLLFPAVPSGPSPCPVSVLWPHLPPPLKHPTSGERSRGSACWAAACCWPRSQSPPWAGAAAARCRWLGLGPGSSGGRCGS